MEYENNQMQFTVEYPYSKEWITWMIKHPANKSRKVYRLVVRLLAVLAIVSGLAAVAIMPIVRTSYLQLSVSALLLLAIGFLQIFSDRIKVNATYKRIRSLQQSDIWNLRFEFNDVITVKNGSHTSVYEYNQMGNLTEDGQAFILWIDNHQYFYLPKEAFVVGDPNEFRTYITPKLGVLRKNAGKTALIIRLIILSAACIYCIGLLLWTVITLFPTHYDSPAAARGAYYGTKTDNQTSFAQIETDDSVAVFYTDQTSDTVSVMLFAKSGKYYTVADTYRFTVPDWADDNDRCKPDALYWNEDGLLQISDASREQVFFTCLHPDYKLTEDFYTEDNYIEEPFTVGGRDYVLYAVVDPVNP